MAKAEWVKLSQEGGSGDASVAVSSKAPHTGREARETILTWTAADVEHIERTVIQEGAEVSTKLRDGNRVSTMETVVFISGTSNEAALSFRMAEPYGNLPFEINSLRAAGMIIPIVPDGLTFIPGDPGKSFAYKFTVSLTLMPPEDFLGTAVKSYLVIEGASGNKISVLIIYHYDEKPYIEISTGTDDGVIHLDAEGNPVTVEVSSNTDWEIV